MKHTYEIETSDDGHVKIEVETNDLAARIDVSGQNSIERIPNEWYKSIRDEHFPTGTKDLVVTLVDTGAVFLITKEMQ
jgi:hypothetical protein|tara:strand:- start:1042 stop:1275 length:234 start_codon:yes stop_codon:yes gene_type:complete